MTKKGKRKLFLGGVLVAAFVVWTVLIQTVDVKPVGQNGTDIGFATFNCWFHKWTGVHMTTYTITDWLGLLPLFICMIFGVIGLVQWVKRRSLVKVDYDLLLDRKCYTLVLLGYLIFEIIPINYRPILINGVVEASYPSSTVLLVLGVLPTLVEQMNRRTQNAVLKRSIMIFAVLFSAYMVIGRLISGVHWFTDIIGSIFLSMGLFYIYKAVVILMHKESE